MRSVRALRTVLLLTSSLPSSYPFALCRFYSPSFCIFLLPLLLSFSLSLVFSLRFVLFLYCLVSFLPFFLFSTRLVCLPLTTIAFCLGFFFSLSHASFLSCSLSCSCPYLLVVICGLAFFLSIVSSSLLLPIQLSFLFFHKFVLFPSLLFLFLFLFSSCYCLFVSRVIF